MKYTPTIGLEIHAELKTNSKMFCSCLNDPLEQHPNVNICPICMGHPGTLPVANEEAIRLVQKVGLALHCEIAEYSKFDRKSYFYPDLPKGYQISQYDMPFCKEGVLKVGDRNIRITRVHLEEDTGKLLHAVTFGPTRISSARIKTPMQKTDEYSLIDFNRAGIPLMELVTEPDITSAEEASAFAQELQLILRYLGVSDADMEKGQMRVEVNISIKPQGQEKLGTKVEVKNLNSFRAVEGAIEYEIQRQTEALESKQSIIQETRGWDDVKKQTYSQREKESAHDYRYFPEPDLPPFHFTKEYINSIKAELPELPQACRKRFAKQYNLSEKEVEIFVQNQRAGDYFEKSVKSGAEPKIAANYILSYLFGLRKDQWPTVENFAGTMQIIVSGGLSSTIAKTILAKSAETGEEPSQIIEKEGLVQITDTSEIEKIAKEIISQNPKAVQDFKKGKQNALQFLVGQLMAKTQGKASPELANRILNQLLTK